MKNDDWSLKGKKWRVQPNSMGEIHERIDQNTKEKDYSFHEESYTEEDIETLRKKLIEDLSEQFPKNQIEIKYLINKRFGVK